jgi:beta-N-acetylhexosaminidase
MHGYTQKPLHYRRIVTRPPHPARLRYVKYLVLVFGLTFAGVSLTAGACATPANSVDYSPPSSDALPSDTLDIQSTPSPLTIEDDRRLGAVDNLIRAAINRRAFPAASVAIGTDRAVHKLRGYGSPVYDSDAGVDEHSVFDLASLTKVIATTTAVMLLHEEGRIDLDAPLARYLPEFARAGKQRVTVRHILTHQAGLIPYRPFHRMGIETREQLIEAIMNEELQYRPGTDTRYSDLGVISLALAVERITGQGFAEYSRDHIFAPLGMNDTGFRGTGVTDQAVIPTEIDEGFRGRLLQGEVHDEAAWLLGGTAGHAGLFSTAEDMARFAHMMVNEGEIDGRQFLKPETIQLFTTRVNPRGSTRALGWDTRSTQGYSSAGTKFGPRSYGHTGFTGTSIWIDPDQKIYVILLANRVHPTRENNRHVQVRSDLADLVYNVLADPSRSTVRPR